MNVQISTETETKSFTRFQRLWIWLRAIDEGFNHDPQEQLCQSHKLLNQQVERLQSRVQDLERRERQGL